MGYCPFLSLGHDTVHCIVTQSAGACSRVATTGPGGPATRPHDMANMGHDTVDRAQGRTAARTQGCAAACARGLASGGVAIQRVTRPTRWQHARCDMALCARDKTLCAPAVGVVSRLGRPRRYDTAYQCAWAQRHGRARPRNGRAQARHGRGGGHDMTQCESHDTALCARLERCARAGWVRVCALYTRLSFDSVHCSESLFETLFMSTVYEVFQKKCFKINKIK